MSEAVRSPNRLLRFVRRDPGATLGLALIAALLAVALFPFLFTDQSPFTIAVNDALQAPSAAHWFGTDDTGRDVYARVIYGTRVTLAICAGSLLISALIGGALGLISGYVGGLVDQALGRLVDVMLSFPPIILGVIITGVLGPAMVNLIIALSIVYMPVFFRIARAGAMAEVGTTYVEAARSIGLTDGAILRRHVARNVTPLILTQYMILFPLILQIQAALGFLGLGVQPPTPSWGQMVAEGRSSMFFQPYLVTIPGIAILVLVISINMMGDGIRDITAPEGRN